MDKKSLNSRVASLSGTDTRTVSQITEALARVTGEILTEGNTVALPGFGDFSPVKTDERIESDAQGRRMLMPPSISVCFTPASALRNKMS